MSSKTVKENVSGSQSRMLFRHEKEWILMYAIMSHTFPKCYGKIKEVSQRDYGLSG